MRISRQPLLGLVTSLVVIVVSLVFISLFDADMFGTWIAYYLMCAIPFNFVVGAFWHGQHPAGIARLRQPWQGLAYLVLAAIVAGVVGTVLLVTVGGGLTTPTPMVTMCVIVSVPLSFWLTVMWGGRPFTRIRRPMVGGAAILVVTYLLAATIYRLFDFAFLAQAPVYSAAVDPHGPFDAWSVLIVVVSAMAGAFLLAHFDLWPFAGHARLERQPVLGLLWTGVALVVATIAVFWGVHLAGMPAPNFLTTVTVPFLFGSILVLNVFQGSLFARIPQPVRGLVSAFTAAVVGLLLAGLYAGVSGLVSGDQQFGAPAFSGEVWLANALLAVTFPFLAFYGDFFHLWPLRRNGSPSADPSAAPEGVRQLRDAIE